LRRAQFAEQTFHGRDMNLCHAAKLSRTYALQVDALKRYRSKGEQRVVVQHQHVNVTADRAAVQVNGGAVSDPGGRGMASKPEDQSHAPDVPRSLAY
jgi:S-adenosylmethionine hydrolase